MLRKCLSNFRAMWLIYIQSHSFDTSRDLLVQHLSTYWVEAQIWFKKILPRQTTQDFETVFSYKLINMIKQNLTVLLFKALRVSNKRIIHLGTYVAHYACTHSLFRKYEKWVSLQINALKCLTSAIHIQTYSNVKRIFFLSYTFSHSALRYAHIWNNLLWISSTE